MPDTTRDSAPSRNRFDGNDRRRFWIDKHLSVGDLIQIALIASGGLWFILTMHTDIAVLSASVAGLRDDVSQIRQDVSRSVDGLNRDVANLNKRIDNIVDGKK